MQKLLYLLALLGLFFEGVSTTSINKLNSSFTQMPKSNLVPLNGVAPGDDTVFFYAFFDTCSSVVKDVCTAIDSSVFHLYQDKGCSVLLPSFRNTAISDSIGRITDSLSLLHDNGVISDEVYSDELKIAGLGYSDLQTVDGLLVKVTICPDPFNNLLYFSVIEVEALEFRETASGYKRLGYLNSNDKISKKISTLIENGEVELVDCKNFSKPTPETLLRSSILLHKVVGNAWGYSDYVLNENERDVLLADFSLFDIVAGDDMLQSSLFSIFNIGEGLDYSSMCYSSSYNESYIREVFDTSYFEDGEVSLKRFMLFVTKDHVKDLPQDLQTVLSTVKLDERYNTCSFIKYRRGYVVLGRTHFILNRVCLDLRTNRNLFAEIKKGKLKTYFVKNLMESPVVVVPRSGADTSKFSLIEDDIFKFRNNSEEDSLFFMHLGLAYISNGISLLHIYYDYDSKGLCRSVGTYDVFCHFMSKLGVDVEIITEFNMQKFKLHNVNIASFDSDIIYNSLVVTEDVDD